MPIGPFKNWDSCIKHMIKKEGYNKETATKVCGALQSKLEKRNVINETYLKVNKDRKMKRNLSPLTPSFVVDEIKETDWMLSIPVTMTTEGVMNGGYKPKEQLMASAWTFDGIPLTFSHPPEGQITSLTQAKGYVSNIDYDPETGDVKGLANIFKTQENDSVVGLIRDGKIREVSIGFWSTDIFQNGIYENKRNGERQKYDLIETDIVGDHLAIMMPNEQGACSPAMGCSLTPNSNSDLPSLPNTKSNPVNTLESTGDFIFSDLPTTQPKKKETHMTDETPPVEVETTDTPPKVEGSNTSDTSTVVVDNSEQVKQLELKLQERDVELGALKKAVEDMKKEPLVRELCDITQEKPESFKDNTLCEVVKFLDIARKSNVARHGLDTGQDNTDSPPRPEDTADAYATDENGNLVYKELGAKDEGVRIW